MNAFNFFDNILYEADWSTGQSVMGEIKGNRINGVSPKYAGLGERFFDYCVGESKKAKVPLKDVIQIILRNEDRPGFGFDPYSWYSKYKGSANFKEECRDFREGRLSPHDFEQKVIEKVNSSGKLRLRNEAGSGRILYDKDGWKVVTPRNFEESVKIASSIKNGEKAHWCTAARKGYFDSYTADGKYPLYIVIHDGTADQFCFNPERPDYKDFNDENPDSFNPFRDYPKGVFDAMGRGDMKDEHDRLFKGKKAYMMMTSIDGIKRRRVVDEQGWFVNRAMNKNNLLDTPFEVEYSSDGKKWSEYNDLDKGASKKVSDVMDDDDKKRRIRYGSNIKNSMRSISLLTKDGHKVNATIWPHLHGSQILFIIYYPERYSSQQFIMDKNMAKNKPDEFMKYARMFKEAKVISTDGKNHTQEELDRKKIPLYHNMLELKKGSITESYFGY